MQDVAIKVNSLALRLQGITRENLQARIYIRADQSLLYGHIMEVMSVIGGAGYQRMALISEPFQGKDSRDLKKNRTLIRMERGFWADEKSMRWCWGLSVLLHGLLGVVFTGAYRFLRLRGLIHPPILSP